MKHPVDPNYIEKPGGKKNPYPSGNEGRLHPGLKLTWPQARYRKTKRARKR